MLAHRDKILVFTEMHILLSPFSKLYFNSFLHLDAKYMNAHISLKFLLDFLHEFKPMNNSNIKVEWLLFTYVTN